MVSVLPREHHVQDDEIRLLAPGHVESLLTIERLEDLESLLGEAEAHRLYDVGLVVDDENSRFHLVTHVTRRALRKREVRFLTVSSSSRRCCRASRLTCAFSEARLTEARSPSTSIG